MSNDYFSLVKRYLGRRIYVTLHGQTSFWGRTAGVAYDALRLTDVYILNELDVSGSYGPPSPELLARCGHWPETLLHLNQIVAVTCPDDDLPEHAADQAPEPAAAKLLVEPSEVLLGAGLAALCATREGDAAACVENARTKLAEELGVLAPRTTVRPGEKLEPGQFEWRLRGMPAGRGKVELERCLALETEVVTQLLPAKAQWLPAYGRRGVWIKRGAQEKAELFGYEVLSPLDAMQRQLEQWMRTRAHELFNRKSFDDLLDQARQSVGPVVDDLVPDPLRPRRLHKLLKLLLRENVPVRDLETILETLADLFHETNDLNDLFEAAEHVRRGLSISLTRRLLGVDGTLAHVSLDPQLEANLERHVRKAGRGFWLEVRRDQADAISAAVGDRLAELRAAHRPEVLIVSAALRPALRVLLAAKHPLCAVMSRDEIDPDATCTEVGQVFCSPVFDLDSKPVEEPPRPLTDGRTPSSTPALDEASGM